MVNGSGGRWLGECYPRPLVAAAAIGVIVVVGISGVVTVAQQQTALPHRPLEFYPDAIQARLEARDRFIRNLPKDVGGMRPEFVIRILRRWKPGGTLTVAFGGGDRNLHAKIASTANEWTKYANINLDFVSNASTGTYRTWSVDDPDFSADVRISFDQPGYWSLVGRDSIDPLVSSPGQASMNLQRFRFVLPADWRGVVLHEFGHALGFEHEHQHSEAGCDTEFRWEDDPEYVPTIDSDAVYVADPQGRRPGIYTVLGGSPNFWPRAKVDFNLRQLKPSRAFAVGPFDGKSIMKYYFEDWMFREGTSSHCYSEESEGLSSEDRRGVAQAYPRAQALVGEVVREDERLVNALLRSEEWQPASRTHYEQQRKSLRE